MVRVITVTIKKDEKNPSRLRLQEGTMSAVKRKLRLKLKLKLRYKSGGS